MHEERASHPTPGGELHGGSLRAAHASPARGDSWKLWPRNGFGGRISRQEWRAGHATARLSDKPDAFMEGERIMLVGYMWVSKADGSQVTDLQRDALLAAGVDARHIYQDAA